MFDLKGWKPSRPVVFAMFLCWAMLAGHVLFGETNPFAPQFYSFLPAVFWMMAEQQRRHAEAIRALRARIDSLEESR